MRLEHCNVLRRISHEDIAKLAYRLWQLRDNSQSTSKEEELANWATAEAMIKEVSSIIFKIMEIDETEKRFGRIFGKEL